MIRCKHIWCEDYCLCHHIYLQMTEKKLWTRILYLILCNIFSPHNLNYSLLLLTSLIQSFALLTDSSVNACTHELFRMKTTRHDHSRSYEIIISNFCLLHHPTKAALNVRRTKDQRIDPTLLFHTTKTARSIPVGICPSFGSIICSWNSPDAAIFETLTRRW